MDEINTSRAERIGEWRRLMTDYENRPGDMGMGEWCGSVGGSGDVPSLDRLLLSQEAERSQDGKYGKTRAGGAVRR